MDSEITDIKNRLDIVDIIGRHLQLKRAGQNFQALCPFHTEKTPSFSVSKSRQSYYCFGCHEHGDIFTFIQKIDNLTFPETLTQLADLANVSLKHHYNQEKIDKNKAEQQQIIKLNLLAQTFWQIKLTQNPAAQKYLKQRGLTPKLITEFNIGFAENSYESLKLYLKQEHQTNADILKSGLATTKDNNQNHIYDKFRNRIIFPITDHTGRTIAFTGRSITIDNIPKYLNSPETPLFTKSKTLFHYHQAKTFIKEQKNLIIVEGQMDVIALSSIGIKNVIALSGTNLSLEQINLIKRLTDHLIFALDFDSAGLRALEKSSLLALAHNCQVEVIPLPTDQDPDNIIQTHGKEFWHKLYTQKLPIIDFLLEFLAQNLNLEKPTDQAQLSTHILPLIKAITNHTIHHFYLEKLSQKIKGNDPEILRRQLKQIKSTTKPKNTTTKPSPEEVFLALLYNQKLPPETLNPQLLEFLTNENAKKLYLCLTIHYNNQKNFTKPITTLNTDLKTYAESLSFKVETLYPDFNSAQLETENTKIYHLLIIKHHKQQITQLKTKLQTLETQNPNSPQCDELNQKIKLLINQ